MNDFLQSIIDRDPAAKTKLSVIWNQSFLVSATIAGSMMLVIVVSALVGTFIPIVLDKQGIDPAIATGPFITTANEIFGIFLFFYVAKIVLSF